MPAWGVAGGGPKNEQAVSDLVAYLKSIQLSPAKAKAQALEEGRGAQEAMAEAAVSDRAGQPRRPRRRRSPTPKTDAQRAEVPESRSPAAQEGITRSQAYDDAGRRTMSQGELLFDVELRPLPHEGLVVRSTRRRRSSRCRRRPGAARSVRRCATARCSSSSPAAPATRDAGLQKQYDWVAVERRGRTRATASAASRRAAWRTSATS